MLKLNAKFEADSLLCSRSHFECNFHKVHMLTQWHLSPPLTSAVKSSLFTCAHSSPLSLAARLHGCHANRSHYINNGWNFSGQTSGIECYIIYVIFLRPFKEIWETLHFGMLYSLWEGRRKGMLYKDCFEIGLFCRVLTQAKDIQLSG